MCYVERDEEGVLVVFTVERALLSVTLSQGETVSAWELVLEQDFGTQWPVTPNRHAQASSWRNQ